MKPYTYQREIADRLQKGQNIILQAPTGAGKTLAALRPFLTHYADPSFTLPRKCVYAVPMRVLANQFETEYKRILREELPLPNPPRIAKQTGEYKEDPEFRADITFATIDQVLSSWLMTPYSLSQRLGNLNAGAFVGSYLIFDEFHLFDPDSTLPTTLHMLKMLNGISPFVLMTATFSKEMLVKLAAHLNAEPLLLDDDLLAEIPAQQKERRFYTTAVPLTGKNDDKQVVAEATAVAHILQTHQAQTISKPRTLIVCNQVERAQAVYIALKAQKPEGVTIRLLHSRFLKKDREAIEQFIRREFQKDRRAQTVPSLIVVATQVVEVGLDMSCAVLHTELAPAASVLQRAGRCARYEREAGQVYVYPLADDGYAPYSGRYARRQAELTWEWLQANQNRHLTFADEQALINHAHTTGDGQILNAVFGAEYERQEEIYKAWEGRKTRGETAVLIREVASVTIVVHSNPDQLTAAPFKADSFALHPGTLQGKFAQWQVANDALDPDFDDGRLDWLVCRLVEDDHTDDEEAIQSNRPIRYGFKPVKTKYELFAPLLAVHPALVGYSSELGLTLYPGNFYESSLPATAVAGSRATYRYRLESYYRHIELVHYAFVTGSLTLFQAAAARLERVYGWHSGIITEMAHLVMAAHDIGKLSTGWQEWAQKWQRGIGQGNLAFPVAHTDYDPDNPAHQIKMSKRPWHAVESALAAFPLLCALVAPDLPACKPLLRAAFTAVARHHAPFASQPGSYQLIATHSQEIAATLELLPEPVRQLCQRSAAHARLNAKTEMRSDELAQLLINPRNEQDVCCYMLLVRALRSADQTGTGLGSQ
jgi:CRISPR-associated endonuclease/helicase Cas3